MDSDESGALLDALFVHLHDAANCSDHEWQLHDLAARDNLAIQHARPNVPADGPTRTLRKVATPMPSNRTRCPRTAGPTDHTIRRTSWIVFLSTTASR